MATELKVTDRLRQAAPDLCNQIEELRKERRAECRRHHYLSTNGREDEAKAVLTRVATIDEGVVKLHAAARQKIVDRVADLMNCKAGVLQRVSTEIDKTVDTVAEENERHYYAVNAIMREQKDRNGHVSRIGKEMDEMAEALTDANQEHTEPDASGAATTNDEAPAEPDARGASDITVQAPSAEATAAVANEGTTPAVKIQCPDCPKTFDTERALRSHARHCKKRQLRQTHQRQPQQQHCQQHHPQMQQHHQMQYHHHHMQHR